jgi:hypothetical protein
MELHSVESMEQQMGQSKAPSSAVETAYRIAAQRVLSSAHSKEHATVRLRAPSSAAGTDYWKFPSTELSSAHLKVPQTARPMVASSVLSRDYRTVLQKERLMARLMDSQKVLLTVRGLESQMETRLASRVETHLVSWMEWLTAVSTEGDSDCSMPSRLGDPLDQVSEYALGSVLQSDDWLEIKLAASLSVTWWVRLLALPSRQVLPVGPIHPSSRKTRETEAHFGSGGVPSWHLAREAAEANATADAARTAERERQAAVQAEAEKGAHDQVRRLSIQDLVVR